MAASRAKEAPSIFPRHGEHRLTPPLRLWLTLVSGAMFSLVGIGAWVRLVDAGVSMVRWEPVLGILPPLGEKAWRGMYDAYTHTPQYTVLHPSAEEFRSLFWPEYVHRVLGRLIFLGLAIPLFSSRVREALGKPRAQRLFAIVGGIVFQGTVGWVMVATGLRDRPMVHPFMLTLHLVVATLLLLALTAEIDPIRPRRLLAMNRASVFALLALATLKLGALVAGLRAGTLYPTFPAFGDAWVPGEAFSCAGFGCFMRGPAMHWWHRIAAYALAVAIVVGVAPLVFHRGAVCAWSLRVCAHVALQIALGAGVVLTHVAVPLAVLHQLNAVVLILSLAALGRRIEWQVQTKAFGVEPARESSRPCA